METTEPVCLAPKLSKCTNKGRYLVKYGNNDDSMKLLKLVLEIEANFVYAIISIS